MRIKLPSLHDFSRDARLLIAVTGILAISFFGIVALLRVIYVLRLGYGPEYIGIFSATGALTYMSMGIPSGALGARLGTRKAMLIGEIIAVFGMTLLPLTEFVPPALRDFWPFFSQVVLTVGWSMFNVNLVPALMASTTEWNRNAAYALSSAFRESGTLVGTFIGGLLPGMFAGLAYHGNGVAMGSFTGKLLSGLLLGRNDVPLPMQMPMSRFPLGRARRALLPPVYLAKGLMDRWPGLRG